MTARSLPWIGQNINGWKTAAAGLVLAATIVCIAILAGGSAARALNGIGALVWLASGVYLAISLPTPPRRAVAWATAAGCGLALGGLVRPGTLTVAFIAFLIAGVIVVLAAGDRSGGWALLAPAIYLPVHLIIGVGRAMVREGGVRTDPPPTAAIVPLAMVLAAVVGGAIAAAWLRRER